MKGLMLMEFANEWHVVNLNHPNIMFSHPSYYVVYEWSKKYATEHKLHFEPVL